MRLICPNCDAQYEVPADVMPLEGREVQCSNCGYAWFQSHPDAPQAETVKQEADEDVVAQQAEDEVTVFEHAPENMLPPLVEQDTAFEDERTAHSEKKVSAEGDDRSIVPSAPPRRELDPAVADVLRAEAELEEQARRNEMTGVESQPELGLSENPSKDAALRAQQAQNRMARMRGEADADTAAKPSDTSVATAHAAPRRDLLPDIEEINSTLRSNNDRSPATDPGQTAQIEEREQRSSRRGFALTVMLVAIGVLIYAFASDIGEAVPQAQQPLTAYVATIDTGRDWLDGQVVLLLGWLDQTAQSTSGE